MKKVSREARISTVTAWQHTYYLNALYGCAYMLEYRRRLYSLMICMEMQRQAMEKREALRACFKAKIFPGKSKFAQMFSLNFLNSVVIGRCRSCPVCYRRGGGCACSVSGLACQFL